MTSAQAEKKLVVELLDKHKGEDIVTLKVGDRTPFAEYFVLVTCPNIRALEALSEDLIEAYESSKYELKAKDGTPDSGWIVVAGEEVITHLFLAVNRKEIDLEGLLTATPSKKKK